MKEDSQGKELVVEDKKRVVDSEEIVVVEDMGGDGDGGEEPDTIRNRN